MLRLPFIAVALATVLAGCGPGRPPEVPDSGTGLPPLNCIDSDGDGIPGTGECVAEGLDCNDQDSAVLPGAPEVCNGVDDDCDGEVDEGLPISTYYKDADGDGFGTSQETGRGCGPAPQGSATQSGDCSDSNAAFRPGADEVCNGLDDDCDGQVDEGLNFQDFYPDADGDGFGSAGAQPQNSCQTGIAGKVANQSDCDDRNPTVKPGALELCNKADDNCDGQVDNGVSFSDYYPDLDGDGFGQSTAIAESSCSQVPGKVLNKDDCNDQNPLIKPGAPEACNGLDDNCTGGEDEGLTFTAYYPDVDGDGFGSSTAGPVSSCKPLAGKVTNRSDCSDANPAVHPAATELCNGVDDNCSGAADEGLTFVSYYPDLDGDGFGDKFAVAASSCVPIAGKVADGTDCQDANSAIHPGAAELCNGADDDCDGSADEGLAFLDYFPDLDADGFGSSTATAQRACLPVPGKVTNSQDCDDALATVNPTATEVCNGQDDDCDGPADEGLPLASYYPDVDGDGFGSMSAAATQACARPSGKVTDNTDCDDNSLFVHPGAAELCNAKDDNCDGQVDNGVVTQNYYPDLDGDGFGAQGSVPQASCAAVAGKVTSSDDCNDANSSIHPGRAEVCNGADDNCSGAIDEGLPFLSYFPDLDADTYGAAGAVPQSSCAPVAGKVANNGDCDDADTRIHPGGTEVCNSIDDDCDGATDEGLTFVNYYPDLDADTYGSSSAAAQSACKPVTGKVTSNNDCNDGLGSVHPGAIEACNGADDNCDGQADEGSPGGGASCGTGQFGVCAAGSLNCQNGSLSCLANLAPSAELCDALDNDCDNQTDETFTNKGQPCTSGLGVCQNSGTFVCSADQTTTLCGAVALSPTAAACDGLDNDCDGIADEPALTSSISVSGLAWQDIEFTPYYYSAASCAGGVNGSGSDALQGGALALAKGTGGILLQRLDASGAALNSPTSATGLTYSDVAIAQAGDGYLLAGIWSFGPEIDLYYMDSQGANRVYLYGQFNPGSANSIDSLRLVRGNGKRVVILWREVISGATPGTTLKMARVEPTWNGSSWSLTNVGGAAAPLASVTLPVASNVEAGLGADSTHQDWGASQTCAPTSYLRPLAISYRSSPTSLNYFTLNEDGSGKGPETVVATSSGSRSLLEPEVAFFRSGLADQWFIAYVTSDSGSPAQADLNYWLTTSPSWHYAYLQYATQGGAASIRRPRASVTGSRIWLSALRYVTDASGFTRQVMTRTLDYAGEKDPPSSLVELSATSGACGAEPACIPGDKDGLASWAAKGRLFYSASGANPTGSFVGALSCH